MAAPRQGDLFGHEGADPSDDDFETPVYHADPEKVREELHKILAEARGKSDAVGYPTHGALSNHIPANDPLPARRGRRAIAVRFRSGIDAARSGVNFRLESIRGHLPSPLAHFVRSVLSRKRERE